MGKPELENGPRRVLLFNSLKRLVAVFQSVTAAGKTLGVTSTAIHYACSGQRMTCKDMFFRWLDDNIELEWDDLGTLTLTDYDALCGTTRKIPKRKYKTQSSK